MHEKLGWTAPPHSFFSIASPCHPAQSSNVYQLMIEIHPSYSNAPACPPLPFFVEKSRPDLWGKMPMPHPMRILFCSPAPLMKTPSHMHAAAVC
jgi:hypothetical protein